MARRLRIVLAILASFLTCGLLTAVQASAAPNDPYSGSNPYTTGCSADGITIATRPIHSQQAVFGTMEVRYSPTCGTNWVRAVMSVQNSGYTVTKGIIRESGQLPDLYYYQDYTTDPAVGSSFGMQVYAPGGICIKVMAEVRDPSGQLIALTGADFPYNPWVTFC
jgi:uncharacterized protein DUF2690